MQEREWNETVDFLVVGSGAAGMTAALTAHDHGLRTLLIEKSRFYGGSTALSGGAVWIPGNHFMPSLGIVDSQAEVFEYLRGLTAGSSSCERIRAYIERAPEMLRYLEQRSEVLFVPVPDYPDYYPERSGGRCGGRTLEPLVFDGLRLGGHLAALRSEPRDSFLMVLMNIKISEVHYIITAGWQMMGFLGVLAARYFFNLRARFARKGNTRLTLGAALAARLRLSLAERGVPLRLETSLHGLVVEGSRVVGAEVNKGGEIVSIQVRRGILLAAGGFESNAALRERFQASPAASEWTVGSESNTGDTIAIAGGTGAAFDLMDESWWTPVFVLPGGRRPRTMIVEKGLAGSLIVDQAGERFTNEAAPYNDIGKAMYARHAATPTIPGYFIFDGNYRRKHSCGPVGPGIWQPDSMLAPYLRDEFLIRAATLAELAEKLEMDAQTLAATVERYNRFADKGVDEDFGRGHSANDRYYSDPSVRPNPCLAVLESPPFYAARVYPGDLGTKGGVVTDSRARVLDCDGQAISGLYAAGNCSASVMGRTYPGAGGTIGPAMTFGYIAALDAAAAAAASAA